MFTKAEVGAVIGKTFCIRLTTLAVESKNGESIPCEIPAGAIVRVLPEPVSCDIRMVKVAWADRELIVFAEVLVIRGEILRAAGQ